MFSNLNISQLIAEFSLLGSVGVRVVLHVFFALILFYLFASSKSFASGDTSESVEMGKKVFSDLGCVACHGPSSGILGPDLSGIYGKQVALSDGTKIKADEDYLKESILNPSAKITSGYAPLMPTFQGNVSQAQLGHLIDYLKSISK